MALLASHSVPITRLAREHIKYLDLLKDGPISVTRNGTPAAVLISVDTWNETVRRLAYLERLAMGDRALARIRAGEYLTAEEVDAGFRELGLA